MTGIKIGFWDYATFASLAIIVFAIVLLLILVMGLPGKIAIARRHPEADAVKLMGWVGFLAIVSWIQALIWAFKPTDMVDIRRFPREEEIATEQAIMRLTGKTASAVSPESKKEKSGHEPGKGDKKRG